MIGCIYDSLFEQHGIPYHPENGTRLAAIVDRLKQAGLWQELEHLQFAPATAEQVGWVHQHDYIEYIRSLSEHGGGALDFETQATEQTYPAAMLAVGGCIAATEAVIASELDSAICLVRPPGHHALPDKAMGFCFFNNVAIAAEAALHAGMSRVAILDFDAHHGNGTQEIFYSRGEVLYFSIHQSPAFPGTGSVDEVGLDDGAGWTINVPLPPGACDKHYLRAWRQIAVPALNAFGPEIVFISAGYDAHWRDPLVNMQMTADGFYRLIQETYAAAVDLCEGRLVVVLEGGYNLDGLALSVENTVLALSGREIRQRDEAPPPLHPDQDKQVTQHLDHAVEQHRQRLGLADS